MGAMKATPFFSSEKKAMYVRPIHVSVNMANQQGIRKIPLRVKPKKISIAHPLVEDLGYPIVHRIGEPFSEFGVGESAYNASSGAADGDPDRASQGLIVVSVEVVL